MAAPHHRRSPSVRASGGAPACGHAALSALRTLDTRTHHGTAPRTAPAAVASSRAHKIMQCRRDALMQLAGALADGADGSMAVGVNRGQAPRHRAAARALRIAAAANRRRRLVAATTRPVVVRVRRLRVRPELRRQRPGVPRRPVCFPFT